MLPFVWVTCSWENEVLGILVWYQAYIRDTPLSSLTKNFQNALTISEAFPVILSGPHGAEVTSSFATVPNNCHISYPCLNTQFIKNEREACLKDFPAKYLTVDPFSSLHAIEGYLWPKVRMENPKQDNTKQEQLLNVAGQQLEKKHKKLVFYLDGQELVHELSLYQTLLCQMQKQDKTFSVAKLWNQVHALCFRRAVESNITILPEYVSNIETAATLFLLKKVHAYSVGEVKIPSNLKSPLPSFEQDEFLNKKLIEKLEQQMGDPLALCIGAMPFWCYQLMISYPFLFSYVTRCKFFKLATYGQPQNQAQGSNSNPRTMRDRRLSLSGLPRKKCLVFRDRILESAAQMMNQNASRKVVLEVEYDGEVGSGFGPTLEFYTLVCKEFQNPGLGLWREDTQYGLFPRPWLKMQDESDGLKISEVQKKFVLLGQVVAKAIQDGRHLDLHISKAFHKLICGKVNGLIFDFI
ncbi:E3 ubiquitin-protein ligase [Medicago truncatula]|uniref:E3 ubiquitin-protein ligase n=1 Tax=Medicago truncatula TaxID=3880 RepID=G7L4I6_MEDTR|nr:E3 ubiquitin-protein ligase [Medicago truncatula]